MAVFVTLAQLPPAALVWRAPTPTELGWLFATATLATAGHYTLTRALRAAELTFIQPFAFLQLVWATLLGAYLFDGSPEVWTWLGGAIVVGAAAYIAHREARMSRAKPRPSGPPP